MDTPQSMLAAQITKYLKKDKRNYRIVLSVSEQEMATLREAADQTGAPLATFVRAAAMLGSIAFLHSVGGES